MFTIYDHPKDFPEFYVVRAWDITATGETLCDPNDPVILETWV